MEVTLTMLLDRASKAGWRVVVRGASEERMAWLDEKLWLMGEGSFLPHGLAGANDGTQDSPIVVGCDGVGAGGQDLLINLGDEIPPFAQGFPRVAELVTSDEQGRQRSRQRYAQYRDQGHELNTHKL